jgi:hypothetical protein
VGACFGFGVESALALRYLRPGGGRALTVVEASAPLASRGELLVTWEARPGRLGARLYGDDRGYALDVDIVGWFGVDRDGTVITVPDRGDPVRREERLWGVPAMLCFLARGDLPVHAAAVEVDGAALLIAAPSRAGKTTLAAAFARAGHPVLTEDLACCKLAGEPSLLPGPAMLRLRRDVAHAVPIPGAEVVGQDDDRLHLALTGAAGADAAPRRIAGIVFLRVADRCDVTPAPPARAARDLWALSFKLPTDADRARAFAGLVDLVGAVPVWDVTRTADLAQVDEVVARVSALALAASPR